MDNFEIILDDGKYRIIRTHGKDGITFHCLRHEEPWRDLLGDKMMYSLCEALVKGRAPSNTLDDIIREAFEHNFTEVQEEYSVIDMDNGAICMVAAQRVLDTLSQRVYAYADQRKWGHIDKVNKAHFDKPHAGGADPFTGG